MRKFNRAILTGVTVLPLTLATAGVAAAGTGAESGAGLDLNAGLSVSAEGYSHYEGEDEGLLGGLLDFDEESEWNSAHEDEFGEDGLLGILG